MLIVKTTTRTMYQNYKREYMHLCWRKIADWQTSTDLIVLKKTSQILSRIEILKIFDMIVAKFDLKVPKSSSCLQSKNEHGFILIQRMYHRFSLVSGDEPMNMV